METNTVDIIHAVHGHVNEALLICDLSPREECELNVRICGVAMKIQEDWSGLIKVNAGGRQVDIIAPLDFALIGIRHSDLKPVEASDLEIWDVVAPRAGVSSLHNT